MRKRKYPLILFIFGLISNLNRTFYVGVLIVLLTIIGLAGSRVIIKISGGLLIAWIIFATVEQLLLRKAALTQSDNEQFNSFMDAALDKDGPFSKNKNKTDIHQIMNEIIEKTKDTKNDVDPKL